MHCLEWTDQRCLHHGDEAGLQREDANEEFGQVANRRLDYARRCRAKVVTKLVGSLADHVGDTRQRKGTRQEAQIRSDVQNMQQCGKTDETRHSPDNGHFFGQFRWSDYVCWRRLEAKRVTPLKAP